MVKKSLEIENVLVESCDTCPFVAGVEEEEPRCTLGEGFPIHIRRCATVPGRCPMFLRDVRVRLASSVHGPSPWLKAEQPDADMLLDDVSARTGAAPETARLARELFDRASTDPRT